MLAVEQLLRDDRCQAPQEVPLAVDDHHLRAQIDRGAAELQLKISREDRRMHETDKYTAQSKRTDTMRTCVLQLVVGREGPLQ